MESSENLETIFKTKAQLLDGKNYVQEFETTGGLAFKIRPLTEGEKAHADSLLSRGMKAQARASDVNNPMFEASTQAMIDNKSDVRFHIIACGLSIPKGEKWTPLEVKNMIVPKNTFYELQNKIMEISFMGEKEGEVKDMLANFRVDNPGEKPDVSPIIKKGTANP